MMSHKPIQHEMMPILDPREVAPPPPERVLGSDAQVQVDLDVPLADSQEMLRQIGLRGNLVATVNAGGKGFLVVDTRNTGSNRDFLIADETFSRESRTGFKGVVEGAFIVIGRGHHADRFSYPATISKEHFGVLYSDGSLFVRNLHPTNQTTVTAHLAAELQPRGPLPPYIEDARTYQVEERLRGHPNFGQEDETTPYGYYMNYPILGRASRLVDGEVYLGGSAREAIVVDGKSVAMKQVYKGVASEFQQSFERNETLPTRAILLRVMHKVQEVMPYDGQKTEVISRQHHGDKLIGLSTLSGSPYTECSSWHLSPQSYKLYASVASKLPEGCVQYMGSLTISDFYLCINTEKSHRNDSLTAKLPIWYTVIDEVKNSIDSGYLANIEYS